MELKLSNIIENYDEFFSRLEKSNNNTQLILKYSEYKYILKVNNNFLPQLINNLLNDFVKNRNITNGIKLFNYTIEEYSAIVDAVNKNNFLIYSSLFDKLQDQTYISKEFSEKLKFKEVKLTGRFFGISSKSYDILFENNYIGCLVEKSNQIAIKFKIKKSPNNNQRQKQIAFEWLTMKRKFDTFDDAMIYLKSTPKLFEVTNFYIKPNY
jgi:hypothetical protein